jgi:hypothetical protein
MIDGEFLDYAGGLFASRVILWRVLNKEKALQRWRRVWSYFEKYLT